MAHQQTGKNLSENQFNKLQYIHTMEYYTAVKAKQKEATVSINKAKK